MDDALPVRCANPDPLQVIRWIHGWHHTTLIDHTPIDYLDFASPVSGLGGKMGLDATGKWPGETEREWGRPIVMDEDVKRRVDGMWDELGL